MSKLINKLRELERIPEGLELTTTQAMEYLPISHLAINRQARVGRLKARRVGGSRTAGYRITPQAILNWWDELYEQGLRR